MNNTWKTSEFAQLKHIVDATLCSCEIYTLILIDLGLETISYWLENKSNLMKFDETYYNQTEATTMGTKCATANACLVVGYTE